MKFFLGIDVARSKAGICLNQRKYALELLSEVGMAGCKPFDTPMEQHLKLTTLEFDHSKHSDESASESDSLLSTPSTYQRLIGRLIYLTITRPDICYAVQVLSQFMHAPKKSHLFAAYCILSYIKKTPGLGLFLSSNNDLQLYAYCDSDWASCPMSRKSTTGFVITLGSSTISWKTKKQNIVSLIRRSGISFHGDDSV